MSFYACAQNNSDQENVSTDIALQDKLLKSMGGVNVWKNANFLYYKEMMYAKSSSEDIIQEVWRDLDSPRTLITLKNSFLDRKRSLNDTNGWGYLESGKYYEFDSLRVVNERAMWSRDLYTICREIATNDKQYTFVDKGDNVMEVRDSNGESLCMIELNESGHPIKWTTKGLEEENSIIYGPLIKMGKIYLPKWLTSVDGHWRFEYVEVKASDAPFDVSYEYSKK